VSITDFTVAPTGAPARYVLDRPVPHTPRLEKLVARPIHEDDDTSTFDRGESSLDEYLRKPGRCRTMRRALCDMSRRQRPIVGHYGLASESICIMI
jgi:hypothetical protein